MTLSRRIDELFTFPENQPILEDMRALARVLENRFQIIEKERTAIEEAVEIIRDVGITRVNIALTPIIQEITDRVRRINALFSTTSDTDSTIGTGTKTFIIEEGTWNTFVSLSHVAVTPGGGAVDAGMVGPVVSYDPETGTLVVNVTDIWGTLGAAYTSWDISATFPTSQLDALSYSIKGDAPPAYDTLGKLYAAMADVIAMGDLGDDIAALDLRMDAVEATNTSQDAAIAGKANATHTHTIAQINTLTETLTTINNNIAARVSKAGDTMTGALTLPAAGLILHLAGLLQDIAVNAANPAAEPRRTQLRASGGKFRITQETTGAELWRAYASEGSPFFQGQAVLTQANAGTYVLPLSGGTMSGLLIANPLNATMAQNDSSSSIEVRNAGGTGNAGVAAMVLHCTGKYAIKTVLRDDGVWGIGGYSRPAWSLYSDQNGNLVSAGNVGAYSDPRLKDNITPIENCLEIVRQWRAYSFTWNERSEGIGKGVGERDIGFLSDEVAMAAPEAVFPSIQEDGSGGHYSLVNYAKLVPIVAGAVAQLENTTLKQMRELRAENGSLRQKMNDMESRLRRLESQR